MITASVVTFHTSVSIVMRLVECLLKYSIDYLFIIDNSSNDSLRIVEKNSDRIRYIYNMNIGYGGGHNIAIRESVLLQSDFHIIVNPDIYFDNDVPRMLADFMNYQTDCGLVMPKVLYPNGDIQYLCKLLPTPWDLFGRRFLPFKSYVERHNNKYELRFTNYDRIMEVPCLSGCFMFIRTKIFEIVKGFDERFFMYAEDLDLCRRIGEIAKTMYYPKASIFHEYEKGSYKNKKLLKYHMESVIKYFNKWGWISDEKRKFINKKTLKRLGYAKR